MKQSNNYAAKIGIVWGVISLLRALDAEVKDPTPFNMRRMLGRAIKLAIPLEELEG